MRKAILILLMLIINAQIPSYAQSVEGQDLNENPDFLAAQTAANCSGLHEFLTLLYQVKRDQGRIAAATKEMTEWKATTKAALNAAGLTRIKVTVQSDEMIEKERQRYLYFMESTPKHLYPEIEAGLEICSANQHLKNQYKPSH